MVPAQLRIASFAEYPPEARALAAQELGLLQELPPVLVPILLRELIGYDWKLPAERRELNRQFLFLHSLTAEQRASALAGFSSFALPSEIAQTDWVGNPSGFMERLTAWLWSTHGMDRFRAVADAYASAVSASAPEEAPSKPRLGIVVVGADVEKADMPLFRKLRPAGLYLTRVVPDDGVAILLAAASARAASSSQGDLRHWCIDGGAEVAAGPLTHVSYARLQPARARLLERIQTAIGSGNMGPEELRSLLARMRPSEVGLSDTGPNAVLDRFQLSLLTEGAGTQIFATTFVQWAARECVRRAQPETLLVRYTPRQQAQTMNLMLSGAKPAAADPAGSLVDADMGAYYTWLNMRRLTGAEQLRFLVWFEGHREALVIAPDLPRGTTSDSPMDMHKVVGLVGGAQG